MNEGGRPPPLNTNGPEAKRPNLVEWWPCRCARSSTPSSTLKPFELGGSSTAIEILVTTSKLGSHRRLLPPELEAQWQWRTLEVLACSPRAACGAIVGGGSCSFRA
ncbi:hypothetical protein NL676_027346 [Syzygium grande]|nr:hypothetical protein NL676_027346 [Syzygium grande]